MATKTPTAERTIKTWSEAETLKDRELAKVGGTTMVKFRILRAIAKVHPAGMTYRQIETATGYYANLTKELRVTAADSLGTLGLIKELVSEDEPLKFAITAAGKKLLEKANKPAPAAKPAKVEK